MTSASKTSGQQKLSRTILIAACIIAAALVLGGYLIGASGGSTPAMRINPWALPLAKASGGRAMLVRSEPGPEGLTKLVFQDRLTGKYFQAWGLPGKAKLVMLTGAIFDGHGKNLTPMVSPWAAASSPAALAAQTQASTLPYPRVQGAPAPRPQPTIPYGGGAINRIGQVPSGQDTQGVTSLQEKLHQTAKILAAKLPATAGVTKSAGSGAPVVTLEVFFDPACPHCHDLYTALARMKDLSVRWIPVAILSRDSIGMGAAILQGKNQALAFNQEHFAEANAMDAAPGFNDAALRQQVAVNTMILASSSNPISVPAIVWRDRSGEPQAYLGNPDTNTLHRIITEAAPTVEAGGTTTTDSTGEPNGH